MMVFLVSVVKLSYHGFFQDTSFRWTGFWQSHFRGFIYITHSAYNNKFLYDQDTTGAAGRD